MDLTGGYGYYWYDDPGTVRKVQKTCATVGVATIFVITPAGPVYVAGKFVVGVGLSIINIWFY